MALPLGKLTILVGAGLLGSVLAQEGGVSKVSDFFSGAFKIAFKHIQQDDSPKTAKKPNDSLLLAQVNSLRQELQLLASSRSVTIITGSRSGATTYGVPVVVVVVVGYGYIWWKGWKLSDLMFATRRSLSDACTTVAKQLEQVHSSISDARKQLSARINHVDSNLDECKELTAATRDEVSELHGDLRGFSVDVESVHRAVQTLETKIGRIEEKQDLTNLGVHRLCGFVKQLEESKSAERVQANQTSSFSNLFSSCTLILDAHFPPFSDSLILQAIPSSSSRPALELPQISPTSRIGSLPPTPRITLAIEPSSPSASNQTPMVSRPLQAASSASGLKDLQGISSLIRATSDPVAPNTTPEMAEPNGDGSSSSSRFGWKLPILNAGFLSRTRSATYSK
ncbi:uncharacterized protein LOC131247163 [Magnolia sinica]|uniref:uncharacterized protein LOC131247163 n=1 Tax=Magnolia sinica TaxID=86752 RepID=UPI0026591B8A|nr:uncharacterized protein LOC131247163 [Magnolia sinica]